MKWQEYIMKRNPNLVVKGFFIEWKLLDEDLHQSMLPCVVQHEIVAKDLPLLEDAPTHACFLLSRPERRMRKFQLCHVFYNATLVTPPSSY